MTEGLRRTEIHFAPARNVLPALITTAIAVVVALVWWSLPRDEIPIVFHIFFGGFGLMFALGLVNLWLRTTRVLVDPYTITIRASYLGLGRTRVIPADEIEDITVGLGTRSGRSNWYDIAVVTRAGKRYRAGGSLPKKKEAEWIAERMRRALGL